MKNKTPEEKANDDLERQFKREIKSGAFIPRRVAGAYFAKRVEYWKQHDSNKGSR